MAHKDCTKHHRKPKSLGGTNDPRNISKVTCSAHQAWHTCFNNKTPQQIVADLNNIWLDPAYKVVLVEVPVTDPNQLSLTLKTK